MRRFSCPMEGTVAASYSPILTSPDLSSALKSPSFRSPLSQATIWRDKALKATFADKDESVAQVVTPALSRNPEGLPQVICNVVEGFRIPVLAGMRVVPLVNIAR